MTKDVIALTAKMPDTTALMVALTAGGADLDAQAVGDGAVIQLLGAAGRPLVSVEAPVLVQVPGEVERLLGTPSATPVWWTETRASTAVPEAAPLAGAVAGRLAEVLGGTVWPEGAGHVGVVPVTSEASAAPAPVGALPTVDVVTESTAVVLADRPVIGLTAWLSDVLRTTAAFGAALHVVTPDHCRLSLPLRTALAGAPNRWVVQDPASGYYDGLSGAVLAWQDGTFAPVRDEAGDARLAAAFRRAEASGERRLTVQFRTEHPAEEGLLVGRSLEAAWRTLTGGPPAGWGTAEPVNLPWSPRQLTDLARSRAPEPTLVTAVGSPERPALATVRVLRTAAGVEEDVTLSLGYGPSEEVPLDALARLAEELVAGHGLVSMLAALGPGRRDLSLTPRVSVPAVPVSFTLGGAGVAEATLTQARRPPLEVKPVQVGPQRRPGLHYPLGEGGDPAAWESLSVLLAHLRTAVPPLP
ncbi:hypothetical protein EF910_33210 [Streptomyces sp. WAC07149]|uniref:DUF6177 family protein n=1 Tax=Streptomyces sp. WAC07149 TaxID=2487425 RepID=UPI000F7A39A0|nr:DUF6177 family protein [Streptomyces sp. WAC07149]RST00009.1 hypothetical protein EF910_33210 [Streptomyces sp. WAC07149]